MNFKVQTTPYFEHSLKKIFKKHRSIKDDIITLIKQLQQEPTIGVEVRPHLYKIRLNISSLNKGKSGGARVITYVLIQDEIVLLADIYLKSESESIDEKSVIEGLKNQGFI